MGERGTEWVVSVQVVWGSAAMAVGGRQAKIRPLLYSSNHASGAALDLPRARHHVGQWQPWPTTHPMSAKRML